MSMSAADGVWFGLPPPIETCRQLRIAVLVVFERAVIALKRSECSDGQTIVGPFPRVGLGLVCSHRLRKRSVDGRLAELYPAHDVRHGEAVLPKLFDLFHYLRRSAEAWGQISRRPTWPC